MVAVGILASTATESTTNIYQRRRTNKRRPGWIRPFTTTSLHSRLRNTSIEPRNNNPLLGLGKWCKFTGYFIRLSLGWLTQSTRIGHEVLELCRYWVSYPDRSSRLRPHRPLQLFRWIHVSSLGDGLDECLLCTIAGLSTILSYPSGDSFVIEACGSPLASALQKHFSHGKIASLVR